MDADAIHAERLEHAMKKTSNSKTGRNQILYIFFYLIFSPDTWRILIGLAAALILGPRAASSGDYSSAGQVVIWLMILVLGYVLSAPAGRFISKRLTTIVRRRQGHGKK